MPAREAYARGYALYGGVECSVGIEYRDGDDVNQMANDAHAYADTAVERYGGNHTLVVASVEGAITCAYPDRAYFIETDEEGKGVQVFQPYGLPRES